MPGLAVLVLLFVVLVFGGLIVGLITGRLNDRRRQRPGDKDLGVEDRGEPRPVHLAVTNEEQSRSR